MAIISMRPTRTGNEVAHLFDCHLFAVQASTRLKDGGNRVHIPRREDEQVPARVQKLIFNPGIKELHRDFSCEYFDLREVILPEGLVTIGITAFAFCKSLLEVKISSTVESIGEGGFRDCENMRKVKFETSPSSPYGLKTIGPYSFFHCFSL